MKRSLAVLLLTVLLTGSGIPQDLPDRLRTAVGSRNYVDAISELWALRSADDGAFIVKNYDYLLGRISESNGDLAAAMVNYQAVADRNSELSPYALKHLSQLARSTGNLMLERIYLNRSLLTAPVGLLARGVRFRLARNAFECGNYGETIRLLTTMQVNPPTVDRARSANKDNLRRENQALLAEAYVRVGLGVKAREIFENLLEKVPASGQSDDVALTAVRGLDLLDGGDSDLGKKAPSLPENEYLRRANIYQFNRDYADSKLHFEALIANYPGGEHTAEALVQIGIGYSRQSEFVESLKWFERVLEQFPGSPAAADATLQAASSYGRVGKPKEAIKRYQTFIEKFPSDERIDRAYLNIVDILRDQGDDTNALKWCAKTGEAFDAKTPQAIALFAEVRIYMARGEWTTALTTLDRLKSFPDLGGTMPGGTTSTELTFLRSFVLEQNRQFSEAIDGYLSIPDGRGEYYGWRATERLKSLGKDDTARSFVSQKIGALFAALKAKDADTRRRSAAGVLRLTEQDDLRQRAIVVLKEAIRSLPRYQVGPAADSTAAASGELKGSQVTRPSVAAALIRLGLYDEAAPEAEVSIQGPNVPDRLGYAIARNYQLGRSSADRVMTFIEPVWKNLPADFPVDAARREDLEMLYPTPYPDVLLASERGVDPRLVLAIMRQESRFQADAKSYAAARGLMQFISTTSTQVADEAGLARFRQDDLYYAPTAILLGTQYLSDLFKIFPAQPEAVLASYNGGDDNMKRWLARARSNMPERYVPEIVYSQSKDYVYKVMANYRMYQFLYDEQLRPK